MSGIFTSKTLGGGYLSNVVSVLYQTPVANIAYLKSFHVTSNEANTQMITLYKRISGNNIRWLTFQLNLGDTADILEGDTITLSAGDGIYANTNVAIANAATFAIHGVEEK